MQWNYNFQNISVYPFMIPLLETKNLCADKFQATINYLVSLWYWYHYSTKGTGQHNNTWL